MFRGFGEARGLIFNDQSVDHFIQSLTRKNAL